LLHGSPTESCVESAKSALIPNVVVYSIDSGGLCIAQLAKVMAFPIDFGKDEVVMRSERISTQYFAT
jgi:hypothetical protein